MHPKYLIDHTDPMPPAVCIVASFSMAALQDIILHSLDLSCSDSLQVSDAWLSKQS